jgi:hypothetical protein
MEGKAFLGNLRRNDGKVAFGFRGRMDERYDMVRTVRDENFRYRLNFMPHRIYGQHIQFLWRAPSMQAWEKAFQQGETNRVQSRFFSPKVQEELYDIGTEPHCVHNLALNPVHADQVIEFRRKIIEQMEKTFDTGVVPEALMMQLSEGSTPYTYMHGLGKKYPEILDAALLATAGKRENMSKLGNMLVHDHPAIRYWGATGCVILREGAMELKDQLAGLLNDPYVTVRIAAAEALYELGEEKIAMDALQKILHNRFQSLLKKEKKLDGYAPEVFELTHALNVITFFDDHGYPMRKEIRAIAEKEKSDYPKRAAEYLMDFFN